MSIQCLVTIEYHRKNIQPLRSCVLIKQLNGHYFISVKNKKYRITYDLAELKHLQYNSLGSGKLRLRFQHPNHLVLLHADNKRLLKDFYDHIKDIVNIVIKRQ